MYIVRRYMCFVACGPGFACRVRVTGKIWYPDLGGEHGAGELEMYQDHKNSARLAHCLHCDVQTKLSSIYGSTE